MQLQISAQNMELSGSTTTYVEEKVGRLDKFLTPPHQESAIAQIQLIYAAHETKATKDQVHITVTGIGHHKQLHVEAEEPDMHVAIDAAAQKLEEQLRREKDKARDHHHRETVAAKEQAANLVDTTPPDRRYESDGETLAETVDAPDPTPADPAAERDDEPGRA